MLYSKIFTYSNMMIVPILLVGFFVLAIGSFCIKQNYYEDAMKKSMSSYRPLLDDSFTERVV
jgi:hypothetical protein